MSEADIRLIVGLGNPGPKYENNRHNLGFRVVEELARRRGLDFRRDDTRYLVAGGSDATDCLVLLMPLTYMNLSGEAVVQWARSEKVAVTGRPDRPVPVSDSGDMDGVADVVEAEDHVDPVVGIRPLVVCDDLNLPLGSVRLRGRGSSGGQNGLASVIDHLDGDYFPRLRLGVAPLDGVVAPEDWPDYVLADFEPDQRSVASEMVDHAAEALEFWLENGLESTISRFNRRIKARPEDSED